MDTQAIARSLAHYVNTPEKMVTANMHKIMRNLEKLTPSERKAELAAYGLVKLSRARSHRR